MSNLPSVEILSQLAETVELECKLAQGRDGKGELPKDFWPTYSAFANTQGGIVMLGIAEKDGVFSVAGIENIEKVRKDLFSTLNDPGKVSINLLNDSHVNAIELDGKTVLQIQIPAATRKQKPVYLDGNPLGKTYRRLNEGDVRLDNESVRRMLAEQVEDERDARILPGFGIDDIDLQSLQIYRQILKAEKPAHPYLEKDDLGLLESLRGWRRDRQSGDSGLTLAGLLMFGNWAAIQESLPHYFVDYQERPEAKTELRWVDRIVPDGTWSGNLFDFYRRVYRKLVTDLKVPFALKDGQRQEDTPIHVALREALVNTLVHADYTGRLSVLVVKRPDMFGFRNPGGLRLPIEQVTRGGESDCRNRILHQMFLLIGLGERAGSGIPKIYSGWKSQHWRPPALYEKLDPEQTLLELRMLDLLPEAVVQKLRALFGSAFDTLDHTGRLVLATAAIERVVSHTRLLEICDAHPRDLTLLLARMVKDGLLASEGRSRGMVYHLPGELLPTPEQVFQEPSPLLSSSEHLLPTSEQMALSSAHLSPTSEHLVLSSEHLPWNANDSTENTEPGSSAVETISETDGYRDARGCLISSHLQAPLIDSLEQLDPQFLSQLEEMAIEPRQKRKLPAGHMQQILLTLCRDQFMTLSALASLVGRNPDALRQQYLNGMAKSRKIQLAFPSKPTHEKQAYRASPVDLAEPSTD